ncbi:MAG TPA: hypothetical protein VNW71_03250 [Thermoanaerobaculia bacterium]|nr:hypothetical protein [Thermoanaerobaculia bacterium]
MRLRSGTIKEYRPIQSKGFNVKGRAVNPDPRNILVSSDARKRSLGAQYGVRVEIPTDAPRLENAYTYEMRLSTTAQRYLLIGYGSDFLYYAPGPLTMRGPRTRAARPRQSPQFPLPPATDELVIEVEYTSPVTAGLETPSRDSAMGGTARNYAAEVIDADWANARTWEWLHIVGHALGGNNEVENLVAGTFDANTQMIPHESAIRAATQYAPLVTVKYEVNVYPETWVAIDIKMTYSFIGREGFHFVSQSFPAQTDISFDKLQYDIWLLS